MFKAVTFLKRRPGMSISEFRAYYEEKHAPLGITFMPQARRYLRRYITPAIYPITGKNEEPDFDVITEVWCESRGEFEEMLVHLSKPENAAIIAADEDRLFDRSRNRLVFVEEVETVLERKDPR